jgi:hypothetical protein
MINIIDGLVFLSGLEKIDLTPRRKERRKNLRPLTTDYCFSLTPKLCLGTKIVGCVSRTILGA